jgi:hypothetical protein
MEKEHNEEDDKFQSQMDNAPSEYHRRNIGVAWDNASEDNRNGEYMIKQHHEGEFAEMGHIIIKRWDTNWRQAVNDYTPPVAAAGAGVQRTLTDILSEDYPIPHVARDMAAGFFEDDHLGARDMIEEWDKAWDKADEEEYKASD